MWCWAEKKNTSSPVGAPRSGVAAVAESSSAKLLRHPRSASAEGGEKMGKNTLFEGMAKSLVSNIRTTEKCRATLRASGVHTGEVDEYLKWVRRISRLRMDCFVVAFGYLYRLVERRRIKDPFLLTRSNWRLLVITAIMIAQKFSNDESYPNTEFIKLLEPDYTIKQLNQMEVEFLGRLNWNCSFTPQEYYDYYRCIVASSHS